MTSNTVDVNVSAAVITAIQVTPSPVDTAKGQTQQLTATATFSDATSSDVSSSVTWSPIDTDTATVSSTGLLSAVEVGNTTLTATKDGVTSNTVDVESCNLAGPCIDIFDVGGGQLFTNSPSVAYLDSIGGSINNGTSFEDGTYGPVGDFYLFNIPQAEALCATYNTLSLGGRNNWRLPLIDELSIELYGVVGNMYLVREWPTLNYYWSSTIVDSELNNDIYLDNGLIKDAFRITRQNYVSCTSNP